MNKISLNKLASKIRGYSSSYGTIGMLDMLFCILTTKVLFRNARLVRRPAYIRGKRWIKVGDGFTTGRGLRMEVFPDDPCDRLRIQIGDHVQVNDYVHIASINSIIIGNYVLIASKVFISDHNHGKYSGVGQESPLTPPAERALHSNPVIIEDNVWIGESVSILPGVRIGKGSIIGTMAVVTHDIPPFSIAVGTPAAVIKHFNFERNSWEQT